MLQRLSALRFTLLILPAMCIASSAVVACSAAVDGDGQSADEVNTRPVIPGDDDGMPYGYYGGGGYGYGSYGTYGYGHP